VLRGHSGMEELGGGLFEEMVQTPLGNCSINTHMVRRLRGTWLHRRMRGRARSPSEPSGLIKSLAPCSDGLSVGLPMFLTKPWQVSANRSAIFAWGWVHYTSTAGGGKDT
jgi:hypothetical protein